MIYLTIYISFFNIQTVSIDNALSIRVGVLRQLAQPLHRRPCLGWQVRCPFGLRVELDCPSGVAFAAWVAVDGFGVVDHTAGEDIARIVAGFAVKVGFFPAFRFDLLEQQSVDFVHRTPFGGGRVPAGVFRPLPTVAGSVEGPRSLVPSAKFAFPVRIGRRLSSRIRSVLRLLSSA